MPRPPQPPRSSLAAATTSTMVGATRDDCLSFVLTAAASPSSSATSSTKSAPSTGSLGLDPDLAVSGSTDGLGALSASSVHLGALLGKLQCPDNMLANPDGALPIRERAHFHGVHLQPPPVFPRLNLPRRDSHAPIANASLLAHARCAQQRASDQTASWRFRVFIFRAIPPLPNPSRKAEGTPALPRLRHSKISRNGASMPVGIILGALTDESLVHCPCPSTGLHIGFIVTDWLLPQTPKSFTNAVNASFRLELVSLDFNNSLFWPSSPNFTSKQEKFESPAIHSEAGICAPKGRDYHCGPLIGLPNSNWILTRGHPYTVTIAKPKTVVNSDLLKPSLVNTPSSFGYGLCPSMIERLNVSQSLPRLEAIQHEGRTYRYFPQYVYAALPHIESQDTETIVHLLQFNYFKSYELPASSPRRFGVSETTPQILRLSSKTPGEGRSAILQSLRLFTQNHIIGLTLRNFGRTPAIPRCVPS
ncbi:hypothetical protein C8R43DRAFT_1143743 [Mycena crocata]|nr:hypothetical protein C8R43DRAFT_1143743 [Mycena crocata]